MADHYSHRPRPDGAYADTRRANREAWGDLDADRPDPATGLAEKMNAARARSAALEDETREERAARRAAEEAAETD